MQFAYLRLGDRSWGLMSHVSVLMNLTMQAIDLLKCGDRRNGIWTFVVEPAAKAAAVRIERRGHTTAAEEEGFHRRDPGAMSDRGMHQRALARADGGRIHPTWIRGPGRRPGQQILGAHGRSNSVPLAIDTAELQQKAAMSDRFNALRNGGAIKSGGKPQHALENAEIFGIIEDVTHETAIDLEHVHREPFEISQGGVAGAEVIKGDGYSHLTASGKDVRDLGYVMKSAGLQHFQFQEGRPNAGVHGKQSAETLNA